MSGSHSDHQRAWENLEARRKIREIAAKHFRDVLCNGGTLDEVDALADDFRTEIGLASVPFHASESQRYQADGMKAFSNMIDQCLQPNETRRNSNG